MGNILELLIIAIVILTWTVIHLAYLKIARWLRLRRRFKRNDRALADQYNVRLRHDIMGQPDINDISFANNPNVGDRTYGAIAPSSDVISDEFKFSNSQNGNIIAESITGGKEDCADFNNGSSNLYVYAGAWRSGGQYIATIKGECSGIKLGGFIEKHGSVVDIDIDNYSDQRHRRSSNMDLTMLRTRDGSPIRWRSWMGVRPTFAEGQAHECVFCLPYPVGILENRGYQLLKILRLVN